MSGIYRTVSAIRVQFAWFLLLTGAVVGAGSLALAAEPSRAPTDVGTDAGTDAGPRDESDASATADGPPNSVHSAPNATLALRLLPPGSALGESPSLAIFPPQKLPIRFDHKRHISMQLACIDCHAGAKTSAKVSDKLLPSPRVCDGCHSANHNDLNAVTMARSTAGSTAGSATGMPTGTMASNSDTCATCHEGYKPGDGNTVARVSIPDANLVFSHRAHATRTIGCGQCHGAVDQVGKATRDQLPRMAGCVRCHTGEGPSGGASGKHAEATPSANADSTASQSQSQGPQGTCETCHLRAENKPGALIRTHFASGEMLPPKWMHNASHDQNFLARHKFVAADDSRFCGTCHKEDECVACHDGRVRPRSIHPNDYISMHAIEAKQATQKCQSCHREQSFCLGCHQRLGITMSGPSNVREPSRFHPPKAIFSDLPRKPGHHAEQAVRNLNACVSCHIERDCVGCHGAIGIGAGFNPHPPGFASRCQMMMSRNPRPCLVCHESNTDVLSRCR